MQIFNVESTSLTADKGTLIPDNLTSPWREVLDILVPNGQLRPVQATHLKPVLHDLASLIVQAPTNAGKSIVGLLACLKAIQAGKRAILIEPLKAIAQEQAEQLQTQQQALAKALHIDLQIRLTTGDYRLTDEFFSDPPPSTGHLIIATPERLEVILRNPDHDKWVDSIGCVCVDEAHLLGDSRRGPGLETTLTHLLGLSTPPRIVLLSATLGDTTSLATWLRAAKPIPAPPRTPPLHMQVVQVPKGDKEQTLIKQCRKVLSQQDTSVLIFASTTARTERLARKLGQKLETKQLGSSGAYSYHSQRSAADRVEIREAVLNGSCRLVVATTALAMGVNLPTTKVIVADAARHNGNETSNIPLNEIIQMCGRAGRGERPGEALVLLNESEPIDPARLAQQLGQQRALDLASPFASMPKGDRSNNVLTVAERIGALLTRYEEGLSPSDIAAHFQRSWGGAHLITSVDDGIRFLEGCFGQHQFDGETRPVGLAWRIDGRCKLTHLGRESFRVAAPISLTIGVANLFRDIMAIDDEDKLLRHFSRIDLLLLLEIRRDRTWKCGKTRLTETLHQQVNRAMPGTPDGPSQLFGTYLLTSGTAEDEIAECQAEAVLGSLYPENSDQVPKASKAWSAAYLATLRALVLNDLIEGRPLDEIAGQYGLKNLDGIQEQWRDDTQWLLSALMPCLDHKAYLHHLKQVCGADEGREMVIKEAFQRLRAHAFNLQEGLKYCSPMGNFLRELREGRAGGGQQVIGTMTIARLEKAGIRTRGDIIARFPNLRGDPEEFIAARMDLEELVKLVGRRSYALQIRAAFRVPH